jgi:hypothetical protein
VTDGCISSLSHLAIGLREKCAHEIVELKPEEYEEPYREPYKCIRCGNTYRRNHLEEVEGKLMAIDYSIFSKGPGRPRRR